MTLFRVAIWLAVGSTGICQELPLASPSPLPAVGEYESFFRTVAQRSRISAPAPSPEVPAGVPATIQAALGFNDSEMEALDRIASNCVSRLSLVRLPSARLIFEARLEAIETGKESSVVDQSLKDMAAEVARITGQAAQQLKSALGDARFQKLDEWLRGGGAKGCWIAPCSVARR